MARTFGRFKLFRGLLTDGVIDPALLEQIRNFANASDVSARSIGIEYLESSGEIIISFGFAVDIDPESVNFEFKKIGNVNSSPLDVLENVLTTEAAAFNSLICHEFFVDKAGDMYAIFMYTV